MREIHSELRKIFPWYNRWHKHPHHQHTHWFGLFSFLLLTSSFISAQTIFLYAERFEAQAQTGNLPAPNHPIYLGYYKVDANYGDFKDEVKNSVNMFMTETDYRLPVNQYKQNLDQDIQEMIALNKDIALGLDWGNDPIVDAALATATPYWNNIDFIMMTDEPSWDKLTTEQNIANLKSRISQRGLASKKILINFTPNQILTGTGYQASNLDIVSFEAYMNFDQQNSSTLASDLTNQIRQMKSAINNNKVGSKEKMIVVQGYARNYCPSAPTLCWTNLNSLKSLQSIPYLEAATDPSVIGLTIFSWSRATGTKDLSQNYNGDCIKREHERIWGAISGTTQPISIACGGGSGGPIQFAPILSQWSPPQTNNGWWPELSPDGRYVAYGNWGQSWVTDLQTKTNYDLSKPTGLPAGARCIAGKWIRSDTLTYVCDSIPGTSGFWRYEVKVGQWTPIKMNDDPLLVMGNRFEAKDGHWASYGAGRFQISKDNKVLVGGRADPNDTGALGGLDGSLLLSACTNNNNSLCVWDGYNLTDTLSIRTPGFNDFEIGGGDYIAYGNRTNLRGICMSDKQDINLKATSSSLSESVSGPVILVNGQPWLFTGAWNSSEGYMLLRPWGQRNSIVIDDLGVHMSIAYNNGVFTIAYNNDVGHLKVITVSENAPKNDLSGGLASETCGNTVSNSCPAPGITSRITTPSKTWNPKQNSGFGWFPHLSPDGRYVGYGFGNLRITDLKTSQERDFSKPFGGSTPSNYACYSPWWIKPTVATAQCVFDDYPPPILTDRIEIDTSDTSSWTARRTTDDPALVSGPGFTAYDGHWATGKVNGTIIYDNQVLISDPNIHWGAVTGQGGWLAFAINTVPPNIWEIWIYQNGNLVKKYQPKHGINSLSINNGYFAYADVKGHQTGVYPDGREVDLAATSWQGDFGGHIVMVQGQPWIVTAATDPSINKDIILLHEWGNTNSIIILGAASGLDTVFDPSTNEFIVAHNDAKGYLTVDWVPLNSQRYNLITDKFYCPVTTSPATTPISCEPGVVQPGIPVICGFSPTIARPGDSINVVGGNLSGTVELLSASGAKYTMTGTIDTAKSNIDFNIANNVPEGDYTLSIIGSDGITRATSNQVLRVVLVIPDAGATGTDIPFGQATGINVPGSTTTFEKIISDFLTYAVYGLGIAIFVMFLYAGFLWMSSAANPGNIALAKRYMTNTVLGAVILLSSYIILYTINPDLVGGTLTLPKITGTVEASSIRYITNNEADSAQAFAAGCSGFVNLGYQDFSAVECPGSVTSLALDPVLQLQDTGANQQVGATVVQNNGNNGANRKIVILDTGYNYNHPELSSSYGGGKDFINNDADPMDDHSGGVGSPGHGSHVAGIITADGIDGRSKGVAPQTKIIAGKVLNSQGQGQFSSIVTAIYWAVNGPDNVFGTTDDFHPDAINLSVGGGAYANFCDNNDATSQAMAQAIQYARSHGTIVVVSAGNNSSGVSMPGCIDSSFTVGAVDSNNTVAGFSGRGNGVDITAPGVNIYSSLLGSNYGIKSGTSMATPIVSGIIALIKSAFPNYTVNQVENAITTTATDLGVPGKDTLYGWGRINASAAGTGSTACTGACGTLVASPASCTKGVTTSNPNCNITLSYTSSGVSPSSLVIKRGGTNLQTLTTANGNVTDNNLNAGAYIYSLQNNSTGSTLSSITVYVYNTGALTSPWLSCILGSNATNPNCNITLSYILSSGITGNVSIYKDGAFWKSAPAPSGTITDNNPAVGIHTYTLRDNSGSTQTSRVVINVASSALKPRVITSISPTSARIGNQITITGANLGNELEVARHYLTVQIHDQDRRRSTTIGVLNDANTQGTWKVDTSLRPGNYTLRVGPDLVPNNISNEVNLTILP